METSIVTGASGGIGRAIVENFLTRGDLVIGVDRAPSTINNLNYKHIECEISDESVAHNLAKGVFSEYKIVHNLVNCAAIIGFRTEVWSIHSGEFEKIVSNNLFTTFWMCKAFSQHFIDNKYGRIVNFGAIAGKDGSAKSSHYASSKAAIIAFTKALGKELASTDDVLCNCVAPAAVETDALMSHSEDDIKQHLSKIPKGRFCKPNEVAELVSWLSSKKCSFSTGAVFDISGGRATY